MNGELLENVNNELQDATSDVQAEDSAKAEENAARIDYAELMRQDAAALCAEFPELYGLRDVTELDNPMRYAALRDLGLSPSEAYLATARRERRDNRAHLGATPAIASAPRGTISDAEMAAARDTFPDMSDAEIRRLYKKVTK